MTNSTVIFSTPIVSSPGERRVVVEIDAKDGSSWAVGRVSDKAPKHFELESKIEIATLQEAAVWALEGNPSIGTAMNGQAGKALAAGVLLLLIGIGIIKPTEVPKS